MGRSYLAPTALLAALTHSLGANAGEITIRVAPVDDLKAVVASVEPAHQLTARARIGGTVSALKIKEGDDVAGGAEIASVVDQKLFLQMQALDQRIRSQQAQRDKAQGDFDRAQELFRRGVYTKALFDQAKTALDVADRNLSALRSDRSVIEQQAAEGSVRAPGPGRILTIPASVGRVVMPGETIATIAEDKYILRLQLPERHARFMRAGDKVEIGARGLHAEAGGGRKQGRVRIVYPEIQGGRVIADVDVEGLGDYFVGERARVYVTTGKRDTIIIPRNAVYRRAGVDFVRLASGEEVVIQLGDAHGDRVEILSGLHDGDVVSTP
ncbi:efflux RND transporter periplasmic adaptor subunit [Methylocystis sp. SC2]|uniref:efflux RND transporter periplasmic adaptor subunit n=1 Tax=Methylocystis sp. (strain SC2) TaxID=187303 RepID=UPI00027AF059|nr:efflux RND transporter periplasmic adaptor subunit [Methylocystis sp. SC2]CCJ07690.1 Efflux transporter, RND family, MFP subunit [Methylocystis sp. SC2]